MSLQISSKFFEKTCIVYFPAFSHICLSVTSDFFYLLIFFLTFLGIRSQSLQFFSKIILLFFFSPNKYFKFPPNFFRGSSNLSKKLAKLFQNISELFSKFLWIHQNFSNFFQKLSVVQISLKFLRIYLKVFQNCFKFFPKVLAISSYPSGITPNFPDNFTRISRFPQISLILNQNLYQNLQKFIRTVSEIF